METKPICILGGGPAGLAAAYSLKRRDRSVKMIERDSQVGGLAKSIYYQGFILDLGPHRFYTKIAPVLKLWDEVLGDQQVTVNRLTRIYHGGKYFNYPLKIAEVILTLGIMENVRVIASYLRARLFPKHHIQNFAQWVTAKFGKRLFEIFFEAYTEKLWGIRCEDISAEWAAQRIKGLSLGRAVRHAIFGNHRRIKSLVDRFQFPRLGSGQLYEKIADYLDDSQTGDRSILLNTEVLRLEYDRDRITQVAIGDRQTGEESILDCDSIISSIPLTLLVESLRPLPPAKVLAAARSLKFRNTILVYLIVESGQLFPDNWLYINESSVQLGRVTNFANWSPDMLPNQHQTPLCCEYWCNFDDTLWHYAEDELLTLAEKELRAIALLQKEKVVSGFVVRLPRTYPIYADNYKESLAEIQAYLSQFTNLQLVGRYGSFKYNNQDHSLLMGILAAENVLSPGKHDLWSINADSEYIEEAHTSNVTTASRPLGMTSPPTRFRQIFQQ
jgi:protoporphyrinogen oxidase